MTVEELALAAANDVASRKTTVESLHIHIVRLLCEQNRMLQILVRYAQEPAPPVRPTYGGGDGGPGLS